MANNVTGNVSQLVLKKFAPGFKSSSVLLNAVDRQVIQGEINANTGETVRLKRPQQFQAIRTSNGNLTGNDPSNLISGTIDASISNYCTVYINYEQLEQAIKLNQLDQLLSPAYQQMNTALELELANYIMKNGGLSLGTIGSPITKWSDVAQCGSMLADIGLNFGKKYAVMDPWAFQALADKQSALQSGNTELIRSAWEDAQIAGNFAGVRALSSNSLANRTSGTAVGTASVTVKTTPTLTYDAVKSTMQMTLTLTAASLGTKTLKAGDQVSFTNNYLINQQTKQVMYRNGAAVPFTATVVADATAVANDITVTLSAAAVFDTTNPQFNTVASAVVATSPVVLEGTASTTYKPNIFMHEKAIAMGTVELPKLYNWDSTVFTSAETGLSMRATMSSDPFTNVQAMRIDILPAFATLLPLGCGQFFGNP